MHLAAGFCPDPLGSLSAPPVPLAAIREEGKGRERKGIGGKERTERRTEVQEGEEEYEEEGERRRIGKGKREGEEKK